MLEIHTIDIEGFETVKEFKDSETGLHAIIAVHNTILGPALGGVRFYPYISKDEAIHDVLRLAKGMTYKSALVEDGLGGGKSVIIGDPKKIKNEKLLYSFGKAVDSLGGKYIVAEDVGTNPQDMIILKKVTDYVVGLPTVESSGDPSRFTAWGVFRGIQAVAERLWNNPSLVGKTIAIQGVGHVGAILADLLFWEGANLIVTDVDLQNEHKQAVLHGALEVKPEDIYDVQCDIFSPCALGGILNSKSIPRLKCKAVAGSANNQLLTVEDGIQLKNWGILYAPDFIINSGGIINVSAEFEPGGYSAKVSRRKVDKIHGTLSKVFELAERSNKSTNEVAIELAEYNLKYKVGQRKLPIIFNKGIKEYV